MNDEINECMKDRLNYFRIYGRMEELLEGLRWKWRVDGGFKVEVES